MKLDATQCLELIKVPVNSKYILQAKEQELRLKMHCDPKLKRAHCSLAINDFLSWVASFLPKDKFKRFEQLVTFPLETVDSTEKIFSELSKFFSAPDQDIKSEFTNPQYSQDFSEYLSSLNNDSFWENQGYSALKTGINSHIVCDLPVQQNSLYPAPYYYLLPIDKVHDVVINKTTGDTEYIIFRQGINELVCIDEIAYRVFWKGEDNSGDYRLKFESIHSVYANTGELIEGLGFTPSRSFYDHSINGTECINKISPITSCLSKLDWLLFWRVSKKYLDLYGAYPIIVSYEEECIYKDEHGNECENGFVNFFYHDAITGSDLRKQKRCPVCEDKGIIGPGSFWTVPAPKDGQDTDMMANPVKIVEISNDKLDYGVTETQRLEDEIFVKATGFHQEATKEAINEKQVRSNFESRQAILDNIRKNFEKAEWFTTNTLAKLRYGKDKYISTSVFYGKEYFLQTPRDISLEYLDAKKSGLPQYEISRIRKTYSQTKFKNNEEQYQRSEILSNLEPYPDFTLQELKIFGVDAIDPEMFELKLNFTALISKFERENTNIVEFGSLISFNLKINTITQKLISYVQQRAKTRPQIEPDSSAKPTG